MIKHAKTDINNEYIKIVNIPFAFQNELILNGILASLLFSRFIDILQITRLSAMLIHHRRNIGENHSFCCQSKSNISILIFIYRDICRFHDFFDEKC